MPIKEILAWWHLPLFLLFIAAWLIGGGYLLARRVAKANERRHPEIGKGVLHMLLAGGAAAIAMAVFYFLLKSIENAAGGPVRAIGMAPAALLSLAIGYAVLFAIYDFKAWQLIKIASPAIGAVLAVSAIIAAVAYLPTRASRVEKGRKDRSEGNLRLISKAIQVYEDFAGGRPPKSLEMLTSEITMGSLKKQPLLTPTHLQSPFIGEGKTGFFYLPVPRVTERTTKRLIVCEYSHSRSSIGRAVMFANNEVRAVPEGEFQSLLADPQNAEFAKAFRAKDAAVAGGK